MMMGLPTSIGEGEACAAQNLRPICWNWRDPCRKFLPADAPEPLKILLRCLPQRWAARIWKAFLTVLRRDHSLLNGMDGIISLSLGCVLTTRTRQIRKTPIRE